MQALMKFCKKYWDYNPLYLIIIDFEWIVVPTIENEEKLCIRVYFIVQISIVQGWVIYHIKALSVVIRTTLKTSKKFHSVEKNRFEIFDFWSILSHNSLLKLNLGHENLVFLK